MYKKEIKPIIIVQGGQYGSESKGMVASYLGKEKGVKWAVRTGAINAGHTVYYKGEKWVMQQLPVGWTNPGTNLIIGPGALVNPSVLFHEIYKLREVDPDIEYRIFIDYRCGLHLPQHEELGAKSDRKYRIGATGKGCSEALRDRIKREPNGMFIDWCADNRNDIPKHMDMMLTDTTHLLRDAYRYGDQILIEGCQGSHLDLHLGPYPYVTHKPTQAIQWVMEAGLPLTYRYHVVLVVRTYPIRVAGNSGPLPNETDWVTVMREINSRLATPRVDPKAIEVFEQALKAVGVSCGPFGDVELKEVPTRALLSLSDERQWELKKVIEMTTVTKRIRRVAHFDMETVVQSCEWNNPQEIVLTFANYLAPQYWGIAPQYVTGEVLQLTEKIHLVTGVPVTRISYGPGEEAMRHGWGQ